MSKSTSQHRIRRLASVLCEIGAECLVLVSCLIAQSAFAAQISPAPGRVVLAAGDIADCASVLPQVSVAAATAAMVGSIPGTVLMLGDGAYPDGRLTDYTDCYHPTWGRLKDRTKPSPGNHEYRTGGADGYFTYFGALAGPGRRGYYSFDLGNWHIISLNSNLAGVSKSAQLAWLRDDLTRHRTGCQLAFWHHPRFSSGAHGDNPGVTDIWKILYEFGVEAVLNGHDHNYERFGRRDPAGRVDAPRGIRQFVVGTGGVPLRKFTRAAPVGRVRDASTHGVLKLTLRDGNYSWAFLPVGGGKFRDSGEGTCH